MSRPARSHSLSPAMAPAAPTGAIPSPTGMPLVLLRLENLAIAIAAVIAYRTTGGDWLAFALFFLLPDVSMLGYLAGPKAGAYLYNLAHTYLAPAILAAAALATGAETALHIALIWGAHMGIDRTLGFGLKYTAGFGETHLGRLTTRASHG